MVQDIPELDQRYQQSLRTFWSLTQKRFYASERGREARKMLQELVASADYETSFKALQDSPPFSERHLDIMSRQPRLNLDGYMSNLRIMTRKRT